jgi:hypothetical protein
MKKYKIINKRLKVALSSQYVILNQDHQLLNQG